MTNDSKVIVHGSIDQVQINFCGTSTNVLFHKLDRIEKNYFFYWILTRRHYWTYKEIRVMIQGFIQYSINPGNTLIRLWRDSPLKIP